MTKITFFHGVIFRIIVSLSAYGMVALYSGDFATIVGGGTLLAAGVFMVTWAVQVSLVARGIPIDPSIVKEAATLKEDEDWDDPICAPFPDNIYHNAWKSSRIRTHRDED